MTREELQGILWPRQQIQGKETIKNCMGKIKTHLQRQEHQTNIRPLQQPYKPREHG